MFLLTKLDEALILYKRNSGGPSSLVRRIIGGTREEDTRHFLGKMKKMSFSLEKKEKVCNFALEGSKTVRQPLRADTHFLLRARMLRTLYSN